jgi:AI-2 transport protein TqsA
MNPSSDTGTASDNKVRDSLVIIASLVIVIAGARYAANVLTPMLLALFIAVICGTPISQLAKRGLPYWLAATLIGLLILGLLLATLILLGSTSEDFIAALPHYREQLQELVQSVFGWLGSHGISVGGNNLAEALNPGAAVSFFGNFLSGLGDTLGNMVLIIFTVIFLLADASSFSGKLARHKGESAEGSLTALQELADSMSGYIATKAKVSLLTGFLVWLGLTVLGVEYAILWGFLAFLLNFVPNIGSALAAIPAIMLSLLEVDPVLTGMIIGLYVVVNTLVGNVIEPAVMGQKVGLSTLAVFLSLVFWGWIFGPVGMLLSVPLTMVIKFIAQQNESTEWLALLVSNTAEEEPPPEPAEESQAAAH